MSVAKSHFSCIFYSRKLKNSLDIVPPAFVCVGVCVKRYVSNVNSLK